MPAFTPLAAPNEKNQPLEVVWTQDEDEDDQSVILENRGIIASIFNVTTTFYSLIISRYFQSRNAQHAKLLALAALALIHFYYLNDFLVKFAAMDQLTRDSNYIKPANIEYRLDVASIKYTFQGFIDVRINL